MCKLFYYNHFLQSAPIDQLGMFSKMIFYLAACLVLCIPSGMETVHRQDSSPTRILKRVHRQNGRQFTDRIEDSSSTNFILYLYGVSQCSPFIVVIMNKRPKIKLIRLPICYCNMVSLLDMHKTAYTSDHYIVYAKIRPISLT